MNQSLSPLDPEVVDKLDVLIDYLESGNLLAEFDMYRWCGSLAPAEDARCLTYHASLLFQDMLSYETYLDYSERLLGVTSHDPCWFWCFSGQWSGFEPTPQHAATRLRYYRKYGECPPSFRRLWYTGASSTQCFSDYDRRELA